MYNTANYDKKPGGRINNVAHSPYANNHPILVLFLFYFCVYFGASAALSVEDDKLGKGLE